MVFKPKESEMVSFPRTTCLRATCRQGPRDQGFGVLVVLFQDRGGSGGGGVGSGGGGLWLFMVIMVIYGLGLAAQG